MRRLVPLVLLACALAMPVRAADTAVAAVAVRAHFSNRTVLTVSSNVLLFDVPPGDEPATAALEFSAAARTAGGSDVVLTVETVHGVEGPGGPADTDTDLSYGGDSAGVLSGTLNGAGPSIVARWHGSGVRGGRLTFTLHASAPGHYTVPVRFVISTP